MPRWPLVPALLLLSLLSTASLADTFGDFTYTTNANFATITGYTGPGGNITIPDVIEGKPVTRIGNYAFANNTNLTNVTIPNSVTEIGSPVWAGVFSSCTALTNVTLPNGIKVIWDYTFQRCTGLTSVNIPDSVVTIRDGAFDGCTALMNVAIPNSVVSIRAIAFSGCDALQNLIIPDGVKEIMHAAFRGCNGLTNVFISKSVTRIEDSVFSDCASLTSIVVDGLNTNYACVDGVLFDKNQTILLTYPTAKSGDYAVPYGVTNIGNSAFIYCTMLTNVTLPDGTAIIGPSAFYGCTNLASINIPDGATQIQDQAFYGCTSLTNISIPESLISIGGYYGVNAFARCTSLTNITVDPANTNYSSLDGVLFNKSQNTLLQFPGGRSGTYLIPLTVTVVRESAFSGCAGLTDFAVSTNSNFSTIDGVLFNKSQTTLIACPAGKTGSYSITNKVNKLGGYAFSDCSGLTNISIPQTITTISSNAFCNCTGLTSIIIPNRANFILESAFSGCIGLTSITIPARVFTIESYAFAACSNLTGVYFEGNAPSVINAKAQFFDATLVTVYYCAGTTGWGTEYAGRPTALWDKTEALGLSYQQIGSAYTIIGYMGAGGNVVIPASIGGLPVTSIADYAFSYVVGASALTNITSITIPNTVTRIGNYAFSRCTGLTNVTIPGSVTSLGYGAFNGCIALTDVTILPGITNIDVETFYGCANLANISIPDSITRIGDGAFRSCKALTDVNLPNSMFNIGTSAFADCTSLSAITVDELNPYYSSLDGVLFDLSQSRLIQCPAGRTGVYNVPNSTRIIGENAFDSCKGLTNITLPNSITNIGAYAFWKCTGLTGVYFEGNAPSNAPANIFTLAPNVTVYYRAGTTGWDTTFAGQPTALWVEQPTYQEWAKNSGLLDQFPSASGESDDADGDRMTNLAEMLAATDPINAASALMFESVLRPDALTDADKTALGTDQHALYFQTVPGKQYGIQSLNALGGTWQTETNVTATTTQKRVLVTKPVSQGFYRLVLVQ